VAALVERHDVSTLGERIRDRVEPVGVRSTSVEQQEAGPGRRTPLEEVELEAVDLDPPVSRGLAGEGAAHGGPCYTASLHRDVYLWPACAGRGEPRRRCPPVALTD